MIVELNVPFADKDKAKAMGARWNPEKRTWYVIAGDNLESFARWFHDWQKQPNKEKPMIKQRKTKPTHKVKPVKQHKGPNIRNHITIGCDYIETNSNEVPWSE